MLKLTYMKKMENFQNGGYFEVLAKMLTRGSFHLER